ncbi:hypothetical protein J4467_03525 [Candidatus Woesearchaeota archaeon]|nr:hypothetical protein [Candidatus Woesearchaeota archaeon]
MATTVLGGTIEFLQDFGFFDVILPFLLIFTITFGVLEKTKIFGVEKFKGEEIPKKNINAMIAFVIAFFVLATKQVVESIQVSIPLVALILVAIVCFLMLVGIFIGHNESLNFFTSFSRFKGFIAGILILAVVAIFFQSFGWLDPVLDFIFGSGSEVFLTLIFVGIVGGVIYFVFKSPSEGSSS